MYGGLVGGVLGLSLGLGFVCLGLLCLGVFGSVSWFGFGVYSCWIVV